MYVGRYLMRKAFYTPGLAMMRSARQSKEYEDSEDEDDEADGEIMDSQVWKHMPHSLYPLILCKLPFLDHLRYCLVSKSWKDLLSSPHFLRSCPTPLLQPKAPWDLYGHHLKRAKKDPQSPCLDVFCPSSMQRFSIPLPVPNPTRLTKLHLFPTSAAGFLCFSLLFRRGFNSYHREDALWVCNPITRSSFLLPPLSADLLDYDSDDDDFGYHFSSSGLACLRAKVRDGKNDFQFVYISPECVLSYCSSEKVWVNLGDNELSLDSSSDCIFFIGERLCALQLDNHGESLHPTSLAILESKKWNEHRLLPLSGGVWNLKPFQAGDNIMLAGLHLAENLSKYHHADKIHLSIWQLDEAKSGWELIDQSPLQHLSKGRRSELLSAEFWVDVIAGPDAVLFQTIDDLTLLWRYPQGWSHPRTRYENPELDRNEFPSQNFLFRPSMQNALGLEPV